MTAALTLALALGLLGLQAVLAARRIQYVDVPLLDLCKAPDFESRCVLSNAQMDARGALSKMFGFTSLRTYGRDVNVTTWKENQSTCHLSGSTDTYAGGLGMQVYGGDQPSVYFCPNAIPAFSQLPFGVLLFEYYYGYSRSGYNSVFVPERVYPLTTEIYYFCDAVERLFDNLYYWYSDTDIYIQRILSPPYTPTFELAAMNCSIVKRIGKPDEVRYKDLNAFFDSHLPTTGLITEPYDPNKTPLQTGGGAGGSAAVSVGVFGVLLSVLLFM